MESYANFLAESIDPIILDILRGVKYSESDAKNKTIITIHENDRFTAKENLEKKLKAKNVSFKDGVKSSSSIDILSTDFRFNDKDYRVFFKPAKQGSGAGDEMTGLGESFQAYASSARQSLGRILMSGEDVFDLKPKNVDADRTLEQCKKLPSNWINTGIVIGNAFNRELGSSTYKFHRGSTLVKQINNEYKLLSRKEGIRLNINKWNPADIWAATTNFRLETAWNTLAEFNQYLLDKFIDKELIGVSLKMLSGPTAKKEIFNKEKSKLEVRFNSYEIVNKNKDFFSADVAKDAYLFYTVNGKNQSMQLRTFSAGVSGWQGEIKGKSAAGGKVGGGNLEQALILAGIRSTKFINQTKFKPYANKGDDKTLLSYITMYKYLSKDKRQNQELLELARNQYKTKGKGWFYSKFLSIQYIYNLITSGKQNEIMKQISLIASSSTDVSSVFYKYS